MKSNPVLDTDFKNAFINARQIQGVLGFASDSEADVSGNCTREDYVFAAWGARKRALFDVFMKVRGKHSVQLVPLPAAIGDDLRDCVAEFVVKLVKQMEGFPFATQGVVLTVFPPNSSGPHNLYLVTMFKTETGKKPQIIVTDKELLPKQNQECKWWKIWKLTNEPSSNTTMKRNISTIASTLITLTMCIAAHCSAQSVQQSYASTHITNTTGKPLSLLNITNENGQKIAELFITGKDAYFGADQHVVKGSGYIQAKPNETVTFLILIKRSQPKEGGPNYRQLAIRANRIDWDGEGKTTAITGIAPIIETSLGEKWKIVSSLEKPTLKDGILSLELEQKGKTSFDIRFGNNGSLVGNADYLFDDSKK